MSGAPSDHDAIHPELAVRLITIMQAIDNVLVANHALRASLKAPPPFGMLCGDRWIPNPVATAVARYGLVPGTDRPSPLIAVWVQCQAVEALRIAWAGRVGPAVEAAPDEPDEAPGLSVETPPSPDEGTEDQLRLGGR